MVLALPSSSSAVESEQAWLVDALPYFDTDYGEPERQSALASIRAECNVYRPTANYLRGLPIPDLDVFLTPVLQTEYKRMVARQDMEKLDLSRCELPSPAGTARAGDKAAWRKAILNARAQNEHLGVRLINLDLMHDYGAEMNLLANKEIEVELAKVEGELRAAREDVLKTHSQRKSAQVEAGHQIRRLEAAWVDRISNNFKMELACDKLMASTAQQAKRLKLDPAEVARRQELPSLL